jgi:hypothetical protein
MNSVLPFTAPAESTLTGGSPASKMQTSADQSNWFGSLFNSEIGNGATNLRQGQPAESAALQQHSRFEVISAGSDDNGLSRLCKNNNLPCQPISLPNDGGVSPESQIIVSATGSAVQDLNLGEGGVSTESQMFVTVSDLDAQVPSRVDSPVSAPIFSQVSRVSRDAPANSTNQINLYLSEEGATNKAPGSTLDIATTALNADLNTSENTVNAGIGFSLNSFTYTENMPEGNNEYVGGTGKPGLTHSVSGVGEKPATGPNSETDPTVSPQQIKSNASDGVSTLDLDEVDTKSTLDGSAELSQSALSPKNLDNPDAIQPVEQPVAEVMSTGLNQSEVNNTADRAIPRNNRVDLNENQIVGLPSTNSVDTVGALDDDNKKRTITDTGNSFTHEENIYEGRIGELSSSNSGEVFSDNRASGNSANEISTSDVNKAEQISGSDQYTIQTQVDAVGRPSGTNAESTVGGESLDQRHGSAESFSSGPAGQEILSELYENVPGQSVNNASVAPGSASEPLVGSAPATVLGAVPQSVVQPMAQPQAVAQPVPDASVAAGSASEPLVGSAPATVAGAAPQPVVQPVEQPQAVVKPVLDASVAPGSASEPLVGPAPATVAGVASQPVAQSIGADSPTVITKSSSGVVNTSAIAPTPESTSSSTSVTPEIISVATINPEFPGRHIETTSVSAPGTSNQAESDVNRLSDQRIHQVTLRAIMSQSGEYSGTKAVVPAPLREFSNVNENGSLAGRFLENESRSTEPLILQREHLLGSIVRSSGPSVVQQVTLAKEPQANQPVPATVVIPDGATVSNGNELKQNVEVASGMINAGVPQADGVLQRRTARHDSAMLIGEGRSGEAEQERLSTVATSSRGQNGGSNNGGMNPDSGVFNGGSATENGSGTNFETSEVWKGAIKDITSLTGRSDSENLELAINRLLQIAIPHAGLRQQVIPKMQALLQQLQASAKTSAQTWQKHSFLMDDGKKFDVSARQADGVIFLKLGSLSPELNRLLQQYQQEIREHLEKTCDTEVNLEFEQPAGDGEFAEAFAGSETVGRAADTVGPGTQANREETGARTKSTRTFGYNRNEWTA